MRSYDRFTLDRIALEFRSRKAFSSLFHRDCIESFAESKQSKEGIRIPAIQLLGKYSDQEIHE